MKSVRLKIPGKVMLAGEYTVLRGGHALAGTVEKFMTIEITHMPEQYRWTIHSDIWPEPKIIQSTNVSETDPLCKAVQSEARRWGLSGGTVSVTSDIQIKDGIGSSSALRVGVCAAMELLKSSAVGANTAKPSTDCIRRAWVLQNEAQGQASGYDIATQFLGGLVEFQPDMSDDVWKPRWFRMPVDGLPQFAHIFVGGAGAPTDTTMMSTASWLDSSHKSERFMDVSETLVDALLTYIRFPTRDHFKKMVDANSAHRGMFTGNPNFPTEIATALANTIGHDSRWTWKTTGAGGEDALLVLGSLDMIKPAVKTLFDLGWRRLDAAFTDQGLSVESVQGFEIEKILAPKSSTKMPVFPIPSRSGSDLIK